MCHMGFCGLINAPASRHLQPFKKIKYKNVAAKVFCPIESSQTYKMWLDNSPGVLLY